MGDRKRIGSLFCFLTNRARNLMAIRTQIRTRVDGPLTIGESRLRLILRDKETHKIAGGATCVVALFICGKLYVANAGDSRYGG
jgi:hypothetical protein